MLIFQGLWNYYLENQTTFLANPTSRVNKMSVLNGVTMHEWILLGFLLFWLWFGITAMTGSLWWGFGVPVSIIALSFMVEYFELNEKKRRAIRRNKPATQAL